MRSKFKAILLALLLLPFGAGCVNIRLVPTPTPTPRFTAAPTPTSTPTTIPTLVAPTRTLTLSFTPFITPTAMARTPTSSPTIPRMPEDLSIDDAWMALNRLSSFRYLTNAEIGPEGGTSTYNVKGVYVQTNQAWHAEWRWKAEEVEPVVEFLSIGDQKWSKVSKGTMWLPLSLLPSGVGQMASDAAPFAYWPRALKVGTLQQGSTRNIAGVQCNDYFFMARATSPQGYDVVSQVILCATANERLPLWMKWSGKADNFLLLVTRELSHINDPTNVVQPPQ